MSHYSDWSEEMQERVARRAAERGLSAMLPAEIVAKGDRAGHPFHGNQYTGGIGGGRGSATSASAIRRRAMGGSSGSGEKIKMRSRGGASSRALRASRTGQPFHGVEGGNTGWQALSFYDKEAPVPTWIKDKQNWKDRPMESDTMVDRIDLGAKELQDAFGVHEDTAMHISRHRHVLTYGPDGEHGYDRQPAGAAFDRLIDRTMKAGLTGADAIRALGIGDGSIDIGARGTFAAVAGSKPKAAPIQHPYDPEAAAHPKGYRSLSSIASEIRRDWGSKVNFGAKPYLDAMRDMGDISQNYGADTGTSIVAYFLSNSSGWKGDTAKRIKAELRAMTKGTKIKRPSGYQPTVANGTVIAQSRHINL